MLLSRRRRTAQIARRALLHFVAAKSNRAANNSQRPSRLLAIPLYHHVDYVRTGLASSPPTRRRRLCCLRDRLGQPLCVSCPKIAPAARDALLRAAAP